MPKRLRSPIWWYGGKGNLVGWILRHLPPHKQYCEPFFGGGSVFFAKEPTEVETINDIDQAVMTFFRVLRDRGEEFIRLAQLTEYSEALWRECRDTWRDEEDELRRAWKWWVVARQSFSGYWDRSWSFSKTASTQLGSVAVARWLTAIELLPHIVQRLRTTQIMCRDYRDAMRAADTSDCLHYLDPPYVPSARRSTNVYHYEMTLEQHRQLVDFLLSGAVKGMVVLSGYRNEIYYPLEEHGWHRIDAQTVCFAAARTVKTRILGTGSAEEKQPRIECLWLNPAAREALAANKWPRQLPLDQEI